MASGSPTSGAENKRHIIEKEIRNIQLQQGKTLREIELPSLVYDAGREFVRTAPNFDRNGEPVRFKMIHKLPLGSDSIYEALQSSVKDTLSDIKNIEEWQQVCKTLLTYAQNLILAPQRPEFRRIKLSNSHYVYKVANKFKRGDEILMCMGYSPGKTATKGDKDIVQDLVYGEGNVITQQVVDTAVDLVVLHSELELMKGWIHQTAREGRDASVFDVLHQRSQDRPLPAPHHQSSQDPPHQAPQRPQSAPQHQRFQDTRSQILPHQRSQDPPHQRSQDSGHQYPPHQRFQDLPQHFQNLPHQRFQDLPQQLSQDPPGVPYQLSHQHSQGPPQPAPRSHANLPRSAQNPANVNPHYPVNYSPQQQQHLAQRGSPPVRPFPNAHQKSPPPVPPAKPQQQQQPSPPRPVVPPKGQYDLKQQQQHLMQEIKYVVPLQHNEIEPHQKKSYKENVKLGSHRAHLEMPRDNVQRVELPQDVRRGSAPANSQGREYHRFLSENYDNSQRQGYAQNQYSSNYAPEKVQMKQPLYPPDKGLHAHKPFHRDEHLHPNQLGLPPIHNAKSADFVHTPEHEQIANPVKSLPPNPDDLPPPVVNRMDLEVMHANVCETPGSHHSGYAPSFQDARSVFDQDLSGPQLENLMSMTPTPVGTPNPVPPAEVYDHWKLPSPQVGDKPSSLERTSDSSEDLYNSGSASGSLEAGVPDSSPSTRQRGGHDTGGGHHRTASPLPKNHSPREVMPQVHETGTDHRKHHRSPLKRDPTYENDEVFKGFAQDYNKSAKSVRVDPDSGSVSKDPDYENQEEIPAMEQQTGHADLHVRHQVAVSRDPDYENQDVIPTTDSSPTIRQRDGQMFGEGRFDAHERYNKSAMEQQTRHADLHVRHQVVVNKDPDYANQEEIQKMEQHSGPEYKNVRRQVAVITNTEGDYAQISYQVVSNSTEHGYRNLPPKPVTKRGYENLPHLDRSQQQQASHCVPAHTGEPQETDLDVGSRSQPQTKLEHPQSHKSRNVDVVKPDLEVGTSEKQPGGQRPYLNELNSHSKQASDISSMRPRAGKHSSSTVRNDMNYDPNAPSSTSRELPPRNVRRADKEDFTIPFPKQDMRKEQAHGASSQSPRRESQPQDQKITRLKDQPKLYHKTTMAPTTKGPGWTCDHCTQIHFDLDIDRCEVCGNSRPSRKCGSLHVNLDKDRCEDCDRGEK